MVGWYAWRVWEWGLSERRFRVFGCGSYASVCGRRGKAILLFRSLLGSVRIERRLIILFYLVCVVKSYCLDFVAVGFSIVCFGID